MFNFFKRNTNRIDEWHPVFSDDVYINPPMAEPIFSDDFPEPEEVDFSFDFDNCLDEIVED